VRLGPNVLRPLAAKTLNDMPAMTVLLLLRIPARVYCLEPSAIVNASCRPYPPHISRNQAAREYHSAAMACVQACELPAGASLRRYLGAGGYADCYVAELSGRVSQPEFIQAFYTSALFKLERLVLAWFLARPSDDLQAAQLARGQIDSFAAWSVEAREPDQLLLCDFQGRTRSWLMTASSADGQRTRLFFGSAVVPVIDRRSGATRMGVAFRLLLGFHRLYSRALLRAAAARLSRRAG